MLEGVFIQNVPFISVSLGSGKAVQDSVFILDTGFTGDLQITPKIAKQLGLVTIGVVETTIANGQTIPMQSALAIAAMEGQTTTVTVIISDSLPLAGIGLLTKFSYKSIIDCKHRTVLLERVS